MWECVLFYHPRAPRALAVSGAFSDWDAMEDVLTVRKRK
jgi:hypothetical protein